MNPDAAVQLDVSSRNVIAVGARSRGTTVAEPDHPRLTYRPELDGIRGVAVLLVLASHTHVIGTAMGGVVGVALFFVLSGYLITTLLLAERAGGAIDVRAFYGRRARRLLPALLALILVTVGYAVIQGQAADYFPAAFAAVFYLTNVFLTFGLPTGLLSHTWSLSLEEQFYLVWPWLLSRMSRRGLIAIASLGIALAWIVRVGLTPTVSAQFRPDVRMDAILFGVLIALVPVSLPRWTTAVGSAALFMVALSDWSWPAMSAAAVVSTVVVLRPGRWLAWRPLVRVGEISYGLYLWHYAPMTILDPLTSTGNVAAIVVVWVVAFALALASERWIERRWRRPRRTHELPAAVVMPNLSPERAG